MNPIQRAWAYVSRKRLRSFILFLILLVLLAGISACLTLMKSNKTVETNLYKSLNTSFSIKKIENHFLNGSFNCSRIESNSISLDA